MLVRRLPETWNSELGEGKYSQLEEEVSEEINKWQENEVASSAAMRCYLLVMAGIQIIFIYFLLLAGRRALHLYYRGSIMSINMND